MTSNHTTNGTARPKTHENLQNKKRCDLIFILTFFIILCAAWLLHPAIQNKFDYSCSNAYHTITMVSKDNDDNMEEDKKNNKRKINTVSPSKDDQGASNAPDKEILSISSKDSKMTTASSNNKATRR